MRQKCLLPLPLFLLLLLPVVAGSDVEAATFIVPSDRELIERAEAIVVATAGASYAYLDDGGRIRTATEFFVEEQLKGSLFAGTTVEVTAPGGTLDGRTMHLSGAPGFQAGERSLLFLAKHEGRWTTVGMMLGRFRFESDECIGDLLVRREEGEEVFGFDAYGVPHRESTRQRERFLAFVRSVVRREPAREDYFVGQASRSTADVRALSFNRNDFLRRGERWQNPVFAFVHRTGDVQVGVPQSVDAIDGGIAVWNSEPNSNVQMSHDGSVASGGTVGDGINQVRFNDPNGDVPPGFGLAATWTVPGVTYALDGETFEDIVETDVIVEEGTQLSYPFFEAVVAHEFGHSLGFRHSDHSGTVPNTDDALMATSIYLNNFTSGAYLRDWDQLAVATVYGAGLPCADPSITSHPQSQTIVSGDSAWLSVTASGSTPLAYQWYRGTTGEATSPVSGATSSSFNTGPLTSDATFWVRVSNGCGSADSDAATITIDCRPVIISTSGNVTIESGTSTTLSVSASGSSLSYQWYEGSSGDTTSPVGGNSASFTTPPLTASTSYWVRVSNSCGAADSPTMTVTVCSTPLILAQPQSQQVLSGQSATLVFDLEGNYSFQWYRGTSGDTSTPVAGATGAIFNTGPLTSTQSFWARASNACGFVNSNTATITVAAACSAPAITAQPAGASITSGQTATLSVTATGTSLNYQWYQGVKGDVSKPVGTNAALFTTPALTATTAYWVRVSNSCGTADSETATVTVASLCSAPTIVAQPASQTVSGRQQATLGVTVEGTAPFTYQWYQGAAGDRSRPVAGATTASFTAPRLTQTTQYWVEVKNNCGTTASTAATITLQPMRRRGVRR